MDMISGVERLWLWGALGMWGACGCGRWCCPSLAVVLQGSLPLPGGADPHGGGARALV